MSSIRCEKSMQPITCTEARALSIAEIGHCLEVSSVEDSAASSVNARIVGG